MWILQTLSFSRNSKSERFVSAKWAHTQVEYISELKIVKFQAALTTSHKEYLSQHPELRNLMADYTQLILQRKPDDVFAFTKAYFTQEEPVAGAGE